MSRSIIIVGNGLGLALNPTYFALQSGLERVWNDTTYLSNEHKGLIRSAISGTSESNPPSSEEQLDTLQVAIIATEFLCSLEGEGLSWVSEQAKELPSAFKKYIHQVALYFHNSGEHLPQDFISHLSEYINNTKSHVVTLNYDNLLYDAFTTSGVLNGYNGPLIDGFLRAGFNEKNLIRFNRDAHGWYLHLHGSPLYIDNKKVMRTERFFLNPEEKNHIVLSHVKHKPLIIGSSHILSSYWRHLDKALDESDKIIIFGYSGLDTHLNNRIRLRNDKEINIVEWQGAGEKNERVAFWKEALNVSRIELIQESNILEFTSWSRL